MPTLRCVSGNELTQALSTVACARTDHDNAQRVHPAGARIDRSDYGVPLDVGEERSFFWLSWALDAS
jgi:hypothetical protein